MPDPPKKIFIKDGDPKNQNIFLSDDLCNVCGGNLPQEGDIGLLNKDHLNCINIAIRRVLIADKTNVRPVILNAPVGTLPGSSEVSIS